MTVREWRGLILAALLVVVALLLGSFIRPSGIYEAPPPPVTATPAPQMENLDGTPNLPYWSYLVPTGKICVEVRGSTYATQAALDIFYNTDAKMIPARSNCAGYPRTNSVKLVPKDLGTAVCAMAGGTTMRKQTVRGILIYVIDDPTVWYNTNAKVVKGCFGTGFAARHVYGHEFLHILGMKHNCQPSNVAVKCTNSDYSWKFDKATAWDRAEINRRY